MILLWSMTADDTASAVFKLGVVDREVPVHSAERDRLSYVFGLVRGVDFMAGFATTAFDIFVDVLEMEVHITVAEISEGRSIGIEGDILVMTLETDSVVIGRERHVELRWEEMAQDAVVF